jgi:murein DD-endopeptidase MepM/ murein hydrolase activator NlpD
MTRPYYLACFAMALAAAAAPPAAAREHKVEQGETLNGIANRAGVKAEDLAKANGLKPPYALRVGQTLTIPKPVAKKDDVKADKGKAASTEKTKAGAVQPANGESYTVKPGETLNGIANRAGVSASTVAKANNLKEPYALRAGQKLTIPGGKPQTAADKPKADTPAKAAQNKPATPAKPAVAKATPSAPAATRESTETEHVVQPGETLGGIANRAGVPQGLIAEANGLAEPYTVQTGQALVIPRPRTHAVADGETGFDIAYRYGVPWKSIALANSLNENDPLKTGQKLVIPTIIKAVPAQVPSVPAPTQTAAPPTPAATTGTTPSFQWPLHGKTLLGFTAPGSANSHNGIDLAATAGAPVKAAAAGKVVFAGEEPKLYGTLVVLEHGNGWHSAYGHLSSVSVKVGDRVAAGDVVGKAGQTGAAHQPALHFEIRKNNMPVDPSKLVPGSSAP